MNTKQIKAELANHLLDLFNEEVLTIENRDEWLYLAFNQNYYLIGYYECSEWLKKHEICVFEGIEFVQEYENQNFGECKQYPNSEKLVNMIAYIIGEELINELNDVNDIESLINKYDLI